MGDSLGEGEAGALLSELGSGWVLGLLSLRLVDKPAPCALTLGSLLAPLKFTMDSPTSGVPFCCDLLR